MTSKSISAAIVLLTLLFVLSISGVAVSRAVEGPVPLNIDGRSMTAFFRTDGRSGSSCVTGEMSVFVTAESAPGAYRLAETWCWRWLGFSVLQVRIPASIRRSPVTFILDCNNPSSRRACPRRK